jgi:hypothetical protein
VEALRGRLGAGGFDRRQPIAEHRSEDVDHLSIAIIGAGELATRALHSRRQRAPLRKAPGLRASTGTRIVSVARIRPYSGKFARSFKAIFCNDISEFESFSIGAGWCQALSDYSVDLVWDVQSQGARFSSGSALGPSHDGITRMRRTNLRRRPCRKTSGRHKDSKRTRLIHRPCGDIAPPVGGIRVFSCCFLFVHNSL